MKYDKLVRDKILNILDKYGKKYKFKVVTNPEELKSYVIKKMHEEIDELSNAKDHESMVEEFADILTVLRKYVEMFNIDDDELNIACYTKGAKKGYFDKNIILLEVEE